MGVTYNPSIVKNGLILCLDPDNIKSYPGNGSNIINIIDNTNQTLNGTFSKSSVGIRLTNTSTTMTSNVSRLNISSYSSIRTIAFWLYMIDNPAGSTYVLDVRSGLANGYIWTGQVGTNWPTISVNGADKTTATTANSFVTGSWRFLTYESDVDFTDDVTMFSRFSNNEGMNCTFGEILFYSRVLTNSEINQNFNATRGRYGI